jgi:hypothetical protein
MVLSTFDTPNRFPLKATAPKKPVYGAIDYFASLRYSRPQAKQA